MSTNLSLRIHSVKCVDETGGNIAERAGNDEIYLGGFLVGGNGQPVKVDPTSIYPHFDDGDIKKFNPPKVFAKLSLQSNVNWPQDFVAGFTLMEKDAGGMSGFINDLFDKLKEELTKEKDKEVARIRATTPGGTATAIAIPWGVIVSAALPHVYNYAKSKISSGIDDDIFPLKDTSVTIPSANHTWNGSNTSPISMIEFRGHEGIYQMFYDWELS